MVPAPDASGRPIDALLAGYACGGLSKPLHVLVATHLALSNENRAYVDALEQLKAGEIERMAPVALSNRDQRLAAIFALPQDPTPPAASADPFLPAPLRDYLGKSARDIPWRTKLPGLKEFVIADDSEGEASLLMIKPGAAMPVHTHEGMEFTLVLQGGFSDAYGDYDVGDIAIADEAVDHRPVADAREGCIAFAVTDAPLRLTGPIGRILHRLMRR